jgi:DNA invertase Pin-like site-specific DNA recombinase
MKTKDKKVALYSRVSKDMQNPENQKKALIERATQEGWGYDYFEEKESTRKTRPIKYELYQRLLKKEYKAVVVWKLDRWARSLPELVREIPTLKERGINFISMKENIDLTSAAGKLQFHMFAAFAEFEREIISERTKQAFYVDDDGVTRSVKSGKAVGKRGADKRQRKKSGYYLRWANKKTRDKYQGGSF